MSFWDLSDGSTAKTEDKEYEVPTANFDPIPNNSDVLAHIKGAKWDKTRGDDPASFISIQWEILEPEQFKGRQIFQKLWVSDLDPNAKDETKAMAKRDKARRMLGVIDSNAKGALMQSGDAPTDDSLALALVGAQMVIKCMVWEINDAQGSMSGNWIAAVRSKDAELHVGTTPPPKQNAGVGNQSTPGAGAGLDLDDEVPW